MYTYISLKRAIFNQSSNYTQIPNNASPLKSPNIAKMWTTFIAIGYDARRKR